MKMYINLKKLIENAKVLIGEKSGLSERNKVNLIFLVFLVNEYH